MYYAVAGVLLAAAYGVYKMHMSDEEQETLYYKNIENKSALDLEAEKNSAGGIARAALISGTIITCGYIIFKMYRKH